MGRSVEVVDGKRKRKKKKKKKKARGGGIGVGISFKQHGPMATFYCLMCVSI